MSSNSLTLVLLLGCLTLCLASQHPEIPGFTPSDPEKLLASRLAHARVLAINIHTMVNRYAGKFDGLPAEKKVKRLGEALKMAEKLGSMLEDVETHILGGGTQESEQVNYNSI